MVLVCAGPGNVWDWAGGSGVVGLALGPILFRWSAIQLVELFPFGGLRV
jgi:hypothetical protein